jgi:hypothetical protein
MPLVELWLLSCMTARTEALGTTKSARSIPEKLKLTPSTLAANLKRDLHDHSSAFHSVS